jgi:hypothetical protein
VVFCLLRLRACLSRIRGGTLSLPRFEARRQNSPGSNPSGTKIFRFFERKERRGAASSSIVGAAAALAQEAHSASSGRGTPSAPAIAANYPTIDADCGERRRFYLWRDFGLYPLRMCCMRHKVNRVQIHTDGSRVFQGGHTESRGLQHAPCVQRQAGQCGQEFVRSRFVHQTR